MSIRLVKTDTISLTSFLGDKIPAYAILSHTWDHGEELSFQEMQDVSSNREHSALKKLGYTKIVGTCWKARENELEYSWIDTCCIDKTSSAELSEAINSMFKWYQKAQVCYVLLSDFEPGDAVESTLPRCRWFKRGWCLQELLAPRHVEFFNKDWAYIGSKVSLKSPISKITRIPEHVLLDSNFIFSVPVAQRMSWAASRQTTREEDLAYCLLGIFDVNLPLLYGEGPKAFLRLQEEIIRRSNDRSIFAFLREFLTQHAEGAQNPSQKDINIFAESPREFSRCHKLEFTNAGSYRGEAFALTNKGLYFRKVELLVDLQCGLFSLPLNCEVNKSSEARMSLRKVGPSLYAIYNDHRFKSCVSPATYAEHNYTIVEQEVYIIQSITPSIQIKLQKAEEYAIQVWSHSLRLSRAIQPIQRAPFSDRWDASRMMFITFGERLIQTYWKVFPYLAQRIAESKCHTTISPLVNFYLVAGFEHPKDVEEARAWVRLYSLDEWRRLEARLGIIANLDDVANHQKMSSVHYRLEMRNMAATATIQLQTKEEIPRFELNLEVDFEAHGQSSYS